MEMVFGIITFLAGVIYVAYQYHKENPGVFTQIGTVLLIVFGPQAIAMFLITSTDISLKAKEIVGGIAIAYIIILFIFWMIYIFDPGKKFAMKDAKMTVDIINEVNALPPPTEEELTRIKVANKLSLDPALKEINDAAAKKLWWNYQYNKRMKERHYGMF